MGELPTFEMLKDMSAILNESLRLYPIVPDNERQALQDTVLPVGGGEDDKSPVLIKVRTGAYGICTDGRISMAQTLRSSSRRGGSMRKVEGGLGVFAVQWGTEDLYWSCVLPYQISELENLWGRVWLTAK